MPRYALVRASVSGDVPRLDARMTSAGYACDDAALNELQVAKGCTHTPGGCPIGYMGHTGHHQLNRVIN
jgi:hypothetical protein